jgi:nucleotide-binding universal stress UspA family protein
MKTILFPTDFSRNANHALNYALEIARKTSSKLILLNAYQMPYNRADMMVSVMDILKEDSVAGLKDTVEKIKTDPRNHSVEIETLSRIGDVVSTVTEIVREKNTDLIVMGSKGESGVFEQIIGSNTASVIKNVVCPVLAVPEKSVYKDPSVFGFAYDMKEIENPKDLRFMASLALEYKAQVQIYCVVSEPQQKVMQEAEARLRLNEFFSSLQTEMYYATNGDIIEGIHELVDKNNPDWVVMVAKRYRLFESLFHTSITKSMVFQTDKPLLVLHNFTS